ncbi:MAG: ABC transporter permease [Desulfovibrio sp.]|jgi:putative ABC transport system permease protein|nr:ABC transporter permease [Desulfovibrio sp.]
MTRLGYLVFLAAQSAWNRRGTLLLIVFSIALSTTLLLGLERVRKQMRESFVQAVSGTDLVIGARGGDMQLVLYAIFHLGGAANNMGYQSAREIAQKPEVAWAVPLSLGDSHKGFPVVATSEDFFRHYRFRGDRQPTFAQGKAFASVFEVVLGAEAAKKLGYALGHKLLLSHGSGGTRATEHTDMPFAVSGILAATGTPVDRSLFISLAGMEAVHLNWRSGAPIPGLHITPEQAIKFGLEPQSITALLVGLKKRSRVFALQQEIQAWKAEPLTGVMPGVALDRLWSMVDTGERALLFVSALVTVTGLAGLAAAILAGLGERRRELAVLRAAGARPADILILPACEALLLLTVGTACGVAVLGGLIAALGPILAEKYGFFLRLSPPETGEWLVLGGIFLAGFLAGLIPAFRAYRMSLSDGLTISV